MRSLSALLIVLLAPSALSQAAQDVTLTAPDGVTVEIDRDDYGVPHVSASTDQALFFGQGFAVAQDRLFQMETFWRAATGRLAEIQGPSALNQDKGVRTVFYTPDERAAQFAEMSDRVQTMMVAYVAGINTYIDSTEVNPAAYLPAEYQGGGFAPERWDQNKLVAVLQFFMRRFGEIGGDELARLDELEQQGADWFEANRPVNDPTAATTIQNTTGTAQPWAPRAVSGYLEGTAAFAAAGAAHLAEARRERDALYTALGVPLKFGSFAATISPGRSESGTAMLLGAPQMGAPSQTTKAITSEVYLEGPSFRIAGMTVPGIPGVIIGQNGNGGGLTWTLTTGYTDNTDTYLEVLGPTQQEYLYQGAYQPFEVFPETYGVAGGGTETEPHFRTVHGPVYFLDSSAGLAASWKHAFWDREMEMVEGLYDVWESNGRFDFEAAMERLTMSFNVFYADRDGTTAYWHVGRYPARPGDADPRLPLDGRGGDEWVGLLDPATHPFEVNPAKGYFANWNNKPAPWWNQGDNVNWAAGRGRPYDGVEFLEASLLGASPVSFDELQELTRVVRSNGTYNEYPGTYQQVIQYSDPFCTDTPYRAENVIPPGQSGFVAIVDGQPVPSPNFSDQWALYQSSAGSGDVLMKPFEMDLVCLVVDTEDGAETGVRLAPPAPNPSAGTTRLAVSLAESGTVHLAVYDALGRQVAVLADGPLAAGDWSLTLDTSSLAPGVYVVRLSADGVAASQRLVVTR